MVAQAWSTANARLCGRCLGADVIFEVPVLGHVHRGRDAIGPSRMPVVSSQWVAAVASPENAQYRLSVPSRRCSGRGAQAGSAHDGAQGYVQAGSANFGARTPQRAGGLSP